MREGYAETPEARLWYWDAGGDGAPIVLCHPASQSCQIWQYQREAFIAAGYRTIAYSRRGYFRSERGPTGQPGTTVGDLANLMDALGVAQAHVLGAAAGGITATAFAIAHPERVTSLILAGTIVAPDEQDWRDMYARLGIANLRGKVSAEFLELGPSYRATQPEGTARFAELGHLATPDGPFQQPIGVRVTWQAMQALAAPALLVTGEADLYAPPPLMQLVADHIPRHRFETIRQCGHAPYWEAPRTFNTLVLDFLAQAG